MIMISTTENTKKRTLIKFNKLKVVKHRQHSKCYPRSAKSFKNKVDILIYMKKKLRIPTDLIYTVKTESF